MPSNIVYDCIDGRIFTLENYKLKSVKIDEEELNQGSSSKNEKHMRHRSAV